MISALVAVVGFLLGLVSSDLATQSLAEAPLRPLSGTCPRCGSRRGWATARCNNCSRTIGLEILLSVLMALAAIGIYWAVGPTWLLAPFAVFLVLTGALMATDIAAMRIVNSLNLPGSGIAILLLAVAAALDGVFPEFLRGLAAGAAYFGGAALLYIIVRGNGFGAGDVKLAPVLGVFTGFLGWSVLGSAVFSTAVIGGVVALVALAFMSARRDTELPYGPAMIIGAWLAIFLLGVGSGTIPS